MEHRPEYPREPVSGEIRSTEVFIPDVPPGQGKVCNVRLRGECYGGSHGGFPHKSVILSRREDLCITLYPDALEKLLAKLHGHLTACRKWEDSIELKPCPFCGCKAHVVKLERIWIQCTNCGARGTAEPLHTISAAVVAARSWNRRSLPEPLDGSADISTGVSSFVSAQKDPQQMEMRTLAAPVAHQTLKEAAERITLLTHADCGAFIYWHIERNGWDCARCGWLAGAGEIEGSQVRV